MSQRVLVFDSDAAFADDVKHNFERMGLDVDVANDGPSGLELASAHRPTLILLSIELPGMNGFLVCKKIKKMAELENVPLVIMSSEVDQETFEQHKKLRTRANEYVRKPIEFPELLNVVRGYVSASNGHAAQVAGAEADGGHGLAQDPGMDIEEAFSMSDDEVIILPDDDSRTGAESQAHEGPDVLAAAPYADHASGSHHDDGEEPTVITADDDMEPVLTATAGDGEVATGVISGAVGEFEPVTSTETALPSDSALPVGAELAPPPINGSGNGSGNGVGGFSVRESAVPRERESVPSLRSISQQMRSLPPIESAAQAAAHAAEIDRLKRELSAAEEKTQAADRRATFAEQRAVGAEKALDAAKRTGGASSRELLDLREQLNRKDRELLELRDQVTARDKHLIEGSDRSLAVERELQDLRDTHSDLQRDLEKKSELVIALTGDKEAARKRLDDAKARAERNEGKVKELSTELDQTRIAHQSELEQLTVDHEQLVTTLRSEQSSALAQLRQTQASELESLTTKHQDEERQRAEAHASELSSLKEQYENQLTEQKRAFDDELNELREEHAVTLKSAATRAEHEKRGALDSLRDELIAAHKERLAESERQLRAAHAQEREELERRHNAQVSELTDNHSQQVSTLSEKLSHTEAARAAVEEQRVRTEEARADFENRLRGMTDERDQLSERGTDLSGQLARAQARSERDHELLDRVRKAMAIGLGLLEEQKHEPV